jgi:hypothetical protein
VSALISAFAVVIGVIIAAAMVTASFATHTTTASTVQFDGVAIATTYLNGSSPIFGPPSQNSCDESPSLGTQWPGPGAGCPSQLVGGDSYDFAFFATGNPGSWPGLWANLTLTAPFNFTVNPGTAASIPTVLSRATGLFVGGGNQLFGAGEWWTWNLVFTMPQPYASPPGGLWLHATLTVQPTNQTYGR